MVVTPSKAQLYTAPNQRKINQFYKFHKQNVSCNSSDIIFYCIDNQRLEDTDSSFNEDIIAACFVRNIGSIKLLRSLFVSPEFRGSGIGKALTESAINHLTNDAIFTLCESRLVPYYLALGFIKTDTSPKELTHLVQKKGLTVLVNP